MNLFDELEEKISDLSAQVEGYNYYAENLVSEIDEIIRKLREQINEKT